MIKIRKPGILCSLQDGGRTGYRAMGIPVSGSMDSESHSFASWLAGNNEIEATIEFAYHGAVIEFLEPAEVAISGSGSRIFANGKEIAFGKSYFIPKNTLLKFQPAPNGIWSYLAVKGGFKTEKILGSKSVYSKAGIGKAIQPNEIVRLNSTFLNEKKEISIINSLPGNAIPQKNSLLRVLPGNEFDLLKKESRQHLFNSEFQILPSSDRMGYRLKGESLSSENKFEMLSTAVMPGTIQLTPDGQLIVLMRDAQTTGGYPRVGKIIEADLPDFAQKRPGEKIRFNETSMEEAENLFFEKENFLQKTKTDLLKEKNNFHSFRM
jgi:antagonist of KipI